MLHALITQREGQNMYGKNPRMFWKLLIRNFMKAWE